MLKGTDLMNNTILIFGAVALIVTVLLIGWGIYFRGDDQ